jgi:spore germination protein GerM
MARANKKKTSIGCLFWVALILLILVIFLFNRETIQTVLDETGFMDIVQNDKQNKLPEVEQVDIPEEKTPEVKDIEISETVIEKPATTAKKPESETVVALAVEPKTVEPEKTPVKIPDQDRKVRRSKMYFIEVQDDGNIGLKGIVRPVYYVDSPLTETMNTLLEGLSGSELNMGLLSLIPDQTKLLSISVKERTAFLNFSDSFRFNSFGVEGYNAQLKQVVYTATEFTNIDSVQILIEGAVIDYMGPEGVYIGKPLGRNNF